MRYRRRKLYALLIALCMAVSMLAPGRRVYADGDENEYSVDFGSGTFDVNGTEVKAYVTDPNEAESQPAQGEILIKENDSIYLVGYDKETMEINIYGENQFRMLLQADDDSKTSLEAKDGDGVYPSEGKLEFRVEPKANNGGGDPPQDEGYLINLGPGAFNVNGTDVYIYLEEPNDGVDPVQGFHNLKDDDPIYLVGFDDETMEVKVNFTGDDFGTKLTVNGSVTSLGDRDAEGLPHAEGENLVLVIQQKGTEPGPIGGDRRAVINLSGLAINGSMSWTGNPGSDRRDDEPVTVDLNKTWTAVQISVNSNEDRTEAEGIDPREADNRTEEQLKRFASQEIRFERDEEDDTVNINFYLGSWADKVYGVKINGVDYSDRLLVDTNGDEVPDKSIFDDRYSWLCHFRDQGFAFTIEDIPVNEAGEGENIHDEYNVEIAIAPNENCFIGNFLWSNDDYFSPDGEEPNDLYIGHSKLTLLSVDYYDADPDYDFDANGGYKHLDISGSEDDGEIPYVHYQLDREGVAASRVPVKTSEMVIPEGAWVTMKIEPYYGYQVVSFSVTEDDIKLNKNSDGASIFRFRVGIGNFHIGAKVEEVGNDVKVDNAENIQNAMVELADGTLETGTARLSVEDIEPDAAKKKKFEKIAEDAGYQIESYLDINLNQVFFQGTGNDEDVWEFPMEDLDQPAMIGFELSDQLTGDKINAGDFIIIHDIHDKGDFEVIETEVLEEGGRTGIGFEADSFSGYAIAKKRVEEKVPSIVYSTHVEKIGWQNDVKDGKLAGTVGLSRRLEAIMISIENAPCSGDIEYRTHVQKIGWQDWVKNGKLAGTSGRALRLEAIQIRLTGEMAEKYDVYYRVQAQTYGWLGWAKNGEYSGTAGYAKRLEAIQIVLVKKGSPAVTGSTKINDVTLDKLGNITSSTKQTPGAAYITPKPDISYTTHVQTYGWQKYVSNGAMAGTSGQAKRLEGIKIKLGSLPYQGGVRYTTHIQSIGWQDNEKYPATWTRDGNMSGTSGESKRLEAIRINLYGEMAEHYDIYYRVHAQTYGWLGWAKNGTAAGTAGYAKRLEGIQIVLVEKGKPAPGKTYNGITSNRTEAYISK